MPTGSDLLELTQAYLRAVESGATGSALAAFYTEDAIQEEYPNQFTPAGARRNVAQILEAAEKGQQILTSQVYEIQNAIQSEDQIALEILWTGLLKTGAEMKARFAVFIEFRDGRICRQRNYDCKI